MLDPDALRAVLPKYLVQAIEHVTFKTEADSEAPSSA